jgi:hypothetical protein
VKVGSHDLAALTLTKSEIPGCKPVTGTVTLTGAAPVGGVVVQLSDNLATTTMPGTVTVPENLTSKTFVISSAPVTVTQNGTVSAKVGTTIKTQPLTVRPMGLTSVTLTPSIVVGGNPVLGKATLECNAGPGPVTVDLSSGNPPVASPVAAGVGVVVPQGLRSANFDVTTNAVQAKSYATIAATANGITKSKRLTVNVAAAVSQTSLRFGNVNVGTTSGPLFATLTNKGATSFSISSILLTGTFAKWFGMTENCPTSLAPGASCTITATFNPLEALTKSATVSITTSATSLPLKLTLSGTGI